MTQKAKAPTQKGFLVLVEVTLVTGKVLYGVDAFAAGSEEEAGNYAFNLFRQKAQEGGAIAYGDMYFAGDAIASFKPKVLGVLDLSDEANANWVRSILVFESWFGAEQREVDSPDDKKGH